MTKVLLISNKDDLTMDFVVKRLQESNVHFYRFNTEELTHSVQINIDFEKDTYKLYDSHLKTEINLKEITSVYYRRPEVPTINSENNLTDGETSFLRNELCYTLEGIYKLLRNAFWVSPLYSIREAENKIYQLSLAKEIGFILPNSIITNQPIQAQEFFHKNSIDCIIKPIKSGLVGEIDDLEVIFTSKLPANTNFNSISCCPTYIQSNIHKKADIRVTVVGMDFFAAKIYSQKSSKSKIDWRKSDTVLDYSKIELPNELKQKCLILMKQLNLQFGAIDFIEMDNGDFVFLEINPNGQWAWIENQLKYNISKSIVKLLTNENFL